MIVIWHNPRCSKSRQALALLHARGAGICVRRYLDDPPTLVELQAAQAALGLPAAAMVRAGEALFGQLALSKTDPNEVLLEAMAAHPRLIERPVVFARGRAVIARPPEKLLGLI